jgi:hypothetical protein
MRRAPDRTEGYAYRRHTKANISKWTDQAVM